MAAKLDCDWNTLFGPLLPFATIEEVAVGLLATLDAIFAPSAPCLEEERHFESEASVAQEAEPVGIGATGAWSGLSTCDEPMDAHKVDVGHIAKERFGRYEANGGILDLTKGIDAVVVTGILAGDTQPYVLRYLVDAEETKHIVGSLGEDLERVTRIVGDDAHYIADELHRHSFVEKVAHRADKNHTRLLPTIGFVEDFGMEGRLEDLLILLLAGWHTAQATSHNFSIAILAGFAELGATCDGVPGSFGPFDIGEFHFAVLNTVRAKYGSRRKHDEDQ